AGGAPRRTSRRNGRLPVGEASGGFGTRLRRGRRHHAPGSTGSPWRRGMPPSPLPPSTIARARPTIGARPAVVCDRNAASIRHRRSVMALKKGVKQLLEEANARIETIPTAEALRLKDDPDTLFVDIRDVRELERD